MRRSAVVTATIRSAKMCQSRIVNRFRNKWLSQTLLDSAARFPRKDVIRFPFKCQFKNASMFLNRTALMFLFRGQWLFLLRTVTRFPEDTARVFL